MKNNETSEIQALLRGGVSAFVLTTALMAFTPTVAAQDEDAAEEEIEQITVTGSRIRRDAFSSAAPLQKIDTDSARMMGITSITDMLQRTSMANGNQIDASINTNAGNSNATEAPPAGGAGSSNIDLRGLGPERTLVLINGRRLGASGVRGAPSQPDLNMIPMAMVESVEILTDAASAVYGADAVAGVVNVLLKNDFEGLDITANYSDPRGNGGRDRGISAVMGGVGDKSRFTIAAEYQDRQRIATGDRRECLMDIENDEQGNIYSGCRSGFFDNVIAASPDGVGFGDGFWIFGTPGSTNIGIDGFSDWQALPLPTGADQVDRASFRNFPYTDYYNDQDDRRNADYVQPLTRFSVVGNASYDVDLGFSDSQIYTEFMYTNRHADITGAGEQIYATVPGMIPEEDANGNLIVDGTGAPILVANPQNPFGTNVQPIITLADNPQVRKVEVQTVRIVAGMKGDFSSGFLGDNNWNYDAYLAYDRGTGYVSQASMNEGNLAMSLNTLRLDSDGNLTCGDLYTDDAWGFLTSESCVPVNLLAPSIYETETEGRLATQAERDWLFGTRTNRTATEQLNWQIYMGGDLFKMPTSDGMVSMAFGVEGRKDTINSSNSRDGVVGDIAAEIVLAEGETNGSRTLKEGYVEVSIPILTGSNMAHYLGVDAAIRFTDESNFGSATTEKVALTYRPTDYMSFSGTYGTSFRAPNMREQFLADQGGAIGGLADLCNVNLSNAVVGGVYDPSLEERSPRVIANCIATGADPTAIGLSGTSSIAFSTGGNADLLPETSRTYTASFKFQQPWSDAYDFSLAVSYWDIEIQNTVREASPAGLIAQCLTELDGAASSACDLITRGSGAGAITDVKAGFINVGLERAKGWDFNTRLGYTFDDVGGEPLDLTWTTVTSLLKVRESRVNADDELNPQQGEVSFPKWRFDSTVAANWKDISVRWVARMIGSQQADVTGLGGGEFNQWPYFTAGLNTRPYGAVPTVWYHDVAVNYTWNRVSLTAGVKNLFDKDVPLISAGAGPNRMNAVSGGGYDFYGRTLFANVKFAF